MANNPEEATSLKGLFQGLIPGDVEVIQGIVKSVSPLQIQAVNDEKLLLNETILIVPKHLTNYTASIDISGGSVNAPTDSKSHSHTISGSASQDSHTHSHEHSHTFSGNTGEGGTDDPHQHSLSGTTSSDSDSDTHTHTHTLTLSSGSESHSHNLSSFSLSGATITVKNALKVGERVHLLSFNKGKKYYVLDRVV